MAQFLYRLGRWCADRAGRVLALWLALLIAVGGAAASFGTPMTSKFSLPGSATFSACWTSSGRRYPS